MLSDVDHLSPPVALLGNGRPTVHGSLLEIGGSMPNGCKCGNVGSGSAEIAAANSATIPRTSSRDRAFHDDEREAVEKANKFIQCSATDFV